MRPSIKEVLAIYGRNPSHCTYGKLYIYKKKKDKKVHIDKEIRKSCIEENINKKTCMNAYPVRVEDNKNVTLPYFESSTPHSEFDMHCTKLEPGERRGWWQDHDEKHLNVPQVQVRGSICNMRSTIMLDSGANVSVISQKMASLTKRKIKRKANLTIDGFGDHNSRAIGTTVIKVTLNALAYVMEVWVCEMPDTLILGTVRCDIFVQ